MNPGTAFRSPIVKSSLLLAACIALNKVLGFLEKTFIARFFGTSAESDAILMAQGLFLTGWLIMEEVVSPALIPVLQTLRGERAGDGRDGILVKVVLVLSLPLSAAYILSPFLFPDFIAGLLYPGFEPATKAMVADLWKLFAWGCFPYFLTPILQAFAHARKLFFLPALFQLLGRATMLTCFMLFARSHGIKAAGWGVIACGFLQGALMLTLLRFAGRVQPTQLSALGLYLGRFGYLAVPLVLGLSFSQACQWVDIRLTSTLSAGAVSALTYARKLVDVPILMGAFCLGVVLLPYLSNYYGRSDFRSFRLHLWRCFWACAVLYSLLGAVYISGGEMLVGWVFGGGRFGNQSTDTVTGLVGLFALGLPVFAVEIMIMQAAFAIRCHWHATLTGMACASLNIAFTLWLFPKFGIMVIPLAQVAQKSAKCVILGTLLLKALRTAESSRQPGTAPVLSCV